jgi:hypothetical protein
VLRDPAAYAGPLITLTGFVLVKFEYSELLQTRQELEVREWQFIHRAAPLRDTLGLTLPRDLPIDGRAYDHLELRLSGRVVPNRVDNQLRPLWDEGAKFEVEGIEFVR